MKKLTLTAMVALALVLTFTQCKKETEKPAATEGKVFVTLNATYGQSGEKTDFTPGNGSFVWSNGVEEYIFVGGSQHEGNFGVLQGTGNGSSSMSFSGYLTAMPEEGETLHFFYLGKGTSTAKSTLDFSNQDGTLANLTNNHVAIGHTTFDGTFGFDVTFSMMVSFAYFNTSAFVNSSSSAETVYLQGDDVYSSATVDYRNGTITGNANKSINIGQAASGVYVALIPSTTSGTTLNFRSFSKTASMTFLSGIQAGKYYSKKNGNALDVEANPATTNTVDLASLTSDYEAASGDILTGKLSGNHKISIADNATVMLDNVTINGTNGNNDKWAGITCEGNATIILKDGSTNTVRGFYDEYPGISIPENHTLTIKGGAAGTGKLTASSNGYGAGIGGGYEKPCGNIEIQGGDINATGGEYAAGIGSGYAASCGAITISGGTVTATGGVWAAGIGGSSEGANCGTITISGGTVTATGGDYAPGIGSGFSASCGDITITNGVTKVTATKGEDTANSIGVGDDGTCGKVTIGGTVYYENNAYVGTGSTYLTQDQIVYP